MTSLKEKATEGDLIRAVKRVPDQDCSEGVCTDLFEPLLHRNPAAWFKSKTEDLRNNLKETSANEEKTVKRTNESLCEHQELLAALARAEEDKVNVAEKEASHCRKKSKTARKAQAGFNDGIWNAYLQEDMVGERGWQECLKKPLFGATCDEVQGVKSNIVDTFTIQEIISMLIGMKALGVEQTEYFHKLHGMGSFEKYSSVMVTSRAFGENKDEMCRLVKFYADVFLPAEASSSPAAPGSSPPPIKPQENKVESSRQKKRPHSSSHQESLKKKKQSTVTGGQKTSDKDQTDGDLESSHQKKRPHSSSLSPIHHQESLKKNKQSTATGGQKTLDKDQTDGDQFVESLMMSACSPGGQQATIQTMIQFPALQLVAAMHALVKSSPIFKQAMQTQMQEYDSSLPPIFEGQEHGSAARSLAFGDSDSVGGDSKEADSY